MIANLTRGAKTASLHLPADRFQIAGVLSYLGVDRLDDYELPCEGQDSSGIMVSLEPTGIAERNIAELCRSEKISLSSSWTSVSRNCLTGGLCMEKSLTKPVRSSALTVSDGYLRIRLPGTTLTVGIVRTTKSGQRRRIPFPMRTPMSTSNCGVIPRSSTGLQASSAIICWNRTIRKKEV